MSAGSPDGARRSSGGMIGRLLMRGQGSEFRRRRLVALVRGAGGGLLNKLLSISMTFIAVPLTIGYLGNERYGAWVTIGAVLSWMALADFGLGTGLTNAITAAASRGRLDLARMHMSNFTVLVGAVCGIVALVLAASWPFVDWQGLIGVGKPETAHEARVALAIAFAIFVLRQPLSATSRIYLAFQEGHIGNRWTAFGSVAGLLALVAVTSVHGRLPMLVLGVYGTSLGVDVASTIWLFGRHRREIRPHWRHIDRGRMNEIAVIGGQFFLVTIMALVTFQSDVIVIAHFRGAGAVPAYSLSYTLFNYAVLPQTLVFPYMWSAYAEAIARGDIAWVRRAFRVHVLGGTAFTVAAVAVLMLIARPFIAWWSGHHVAVPLGLVLLMAAWSVINAFASAASCLLAAASHLRYQLVYSGLATVVNLVLSIILVQRIGVEGVIGGTVAAYLVFVCGPALIDTRLLLRRLARHAGDTGQPSGSMVGADGGTIA